jgi:Tat protein secretion system quality control protein TatD with DNase activity
VVGEFIAELRNDPVDEVAGATFANACAFYGV